MNLFVDGLNCNSNQSHQIFAPSSPCRYLSRGPRRRLGLQQHVNHRTRRRSRSLDDICIRQQKFPNVRRESPDQPHALSPDAKYLAASVSPFNEPTGVNPAEKLKAVGDGLHSYGSYLTQCLPKYIQQFSVVKDELTLYVAPQSIVPTLTFLRDHSNCQYKSVMDIAGVDYPTRGNRFEVVYNLLSHKFNSRIRVKTYADEATPVPSVCGVFRGADW